MFNCLNKKKNEKEKTPTEPHPLPEPRPLLYINGEVRIDEEKRRVIRYYHGEYGRMHNGPYVVEGEFYRSYIDKFYAVICVNLPVTIHHNICVPIILAEFDNYEDAANKSTDAYQKYTSHIDAEKNAEKNLFIEKVKNICGADSE